MVEFGLDLEDPIIQIIKLTVTATLALIIVILMLICLARQLYLLVLLAAQQLLVLGHQIIALKVLLQGLD